MDRTHEDVVTLCQVCGKKPARHLYAARVIVSTRVYRRVEGNTFRYGRDLFTPARLGHLSVLVNTYTKEVVTPDAICIYGDLFAYKADRRSRFELRTCSRACGVATAAPRNLFLIRGTDGSTIAPTQERFDQYARDNDPTLFSLINEDSWTTRESELRGLIASKIHLPARLLALTAAIIDEGKLELAREAIHFMLDQYPIDTIATQCAMLLSRIGAHDEINSIFERVVAMYGKLENMPAEQLSCWAFDLLGVDEERATRLSELALKKNSWKSTIVENHVAIICHNQPGAAVEFAKSHSIYFKSDVGYYSAGMACAKTGDNATAEEYLRMADAICEDPMNKLYLAEVLYRAGRSAEALEQIRRGKEMVESYKVDSMPNVDGTREISYGYPYEQKKALQKGFLAVEGKCLVASGEVEAGRKRVRDALDIRCPVTADLMYEGLEQIAEGYLEREKLDRAYLDAQMTAAAESQRSATATRSLEKLCDLVSAIGALQSDWKSSLDALVTEAQTEAAAEQFSTRIHAFCAAVGAFEGRRYERAVETAKKSFASLPFQVIKQLASADCLLECAGSLEAPIFAGVVVEFSKALETAVNLILVEPFTRATMPKADGPYRRTLRSDSGRVYTIELAFRANPKRLTCGDIIVWLQNPDRDLSSFLDRVPAQSRVWILSDLPRIVQRVKDEFRNGCAHYSLAERGRAVALRSYLEESRVFHHLDELAGTCSRPSTH